MSNRIVLIVIAASVVALAAFTSLFTVNENAIALRTEFGAVTGGAYAPGLHWKLPWDQVVRFDRRVLTRSNPMQTFRTSDNRELIIDSYIKWQVANPIAYYDATGGSEQSAGDRVSAIVTNGIKTVVVGRTLEQVVTANRAAVTGAALAAASRGIAALGIRLIDVRIESIGLPDPVASRVYDRMKQSFAEVANRLRAEGESSATTIRATADRERTDIISDAQRDALKLKGAADATAADTYARAYSSDPEFYAFYRSMQAYERALGKSNGVLVLSPDSAFFKYMRDPEPAHR
ncbi:MAG: protease modulator HflC [Steroidobacteraceae bacterium]